MAIAYESSAWAQVKEGWRQLYGSFARQGVSVENHEFRAAEPLDWGRSFHRDSVELCLNLRGTGTVRDGRTEAHYLPRTVGFYCNTKADLQAQRAAGETHSFITIEFSRGYVESQVESMEDALHPALRRWLSKRAGSAADVGVMSPGQEITFQALRQPPVPVAARKLWYQAKTLELLSQVLFEPAPKEEFFCQRQKRVARERVERTTAILRAHLAEPPDIEALGAQVGCSPFYLSRLFSKEMGMTIPQYLRQLRMERAAELLLAGRHNVTETAMEVGYSSLSHFSKAFCTTIGCCPALFPSATALVQKFQARKSLL
ncbi:MAG TPA: AraC family transcriptional regulator [Candidatus Methylacidiphilales bacterium]|nr:AraC family transcriptional regulator [Candidatus Methylacidiphilales bacterium]